MLLESPEILKDAMDRINTDPINDLTSFNDELNTIQYTLNYFKKDSGSFKSSVLENRSNDLLNLISNGNDSLPIKFNLLNDLFEKSLINEKQRYDMVVSPNGISKQLINTPIQTLKSFYLRFEEYISLVISLENHAIDNKPIEKRILNTKKDELLNLIENGNDIPETKASCINDLLQDGVISQEYGLSILKRHFFEAKDYNDARAYLFYLQTYMNNGLNLEQINSHLNNLRNNAIPVSKTSLWLKSILKFAKDIN